MGSTLKLFFMNSNLVGRWVEATYLRICSDKPLSDFIRLQVKMLITDKVINQCQQLNRNLGGSTTTNPSIKIRATIAFAAYFLALKDFQADFLEFHQVMSFIRGLRVTIQTLNAILSLQ